MDALRVCKDAVHSNDSGIGCAVVALEPSREIAKYLRNSEQEHLLQAFIEMAQVLLSESDKAFSLDAKGSESSSAEIHVSGEILGYARLIPSKRVLVALVITPSQNVGLGWATLSVAASQLEQLLLDCPRVFFASSRCDTFAFMGDLS